MFINKSAFNKNSNLYLYSKKIMSLQIGRSVFGNIANKNNVLSKQAAMELMQQWVLNPKLQLHMLQVAHLMKCWAEEKENLSEEECWKWEMAG